MQEPENKSAQLFMDSNQGCPCSGSVLNPNFPIGCGFPFPDRRGAFQFRNGPFAGFESLLAVFATGNDEANVFTDVNVSDTVNDAHVDESKIRDAFLPDFRQLFLSHLRVMLKVQAGNVLTLTHLPARAQKNGYAADVAG